MAQAQFLAVSDIEAVYQDVILALRGVSLSVAEGSIVALLGGNGAGKSTTLKSVSNLISSERGRVSRGTIHWRDRNIVGRDPAQLVTDGLVQVLEGRHVFPQLTVEQNLVTGAYVRGLKRNEIAQELEKIYAWFPRLKVRRASRAGLTSGGEQQMVAIGRALMAQPRLLLLDEPSLGLSPLIVQAMFDAIREVHAGGMSVLLVEQNVAQALSIADRAYLLEEGRIVAEGTPDTVFGNPALRRAYLGAVTGS
jgi:branched-chain amino acid transport system ATP-binding protein